VRDEEGYAFNAHPFRSDNLVAFRINVLRTRARLGGYQFKRSRDGAERALTPDRRTGGCACLAPGDRLPVGDTTAGESNTAGLGAGLPEIN
jgi:hypothetical protein